jgi:hypothetical protein
MRLIDSLVYSYTPNGVRCTARQVVKFTFIIEVVTPSVLNMSSTESKYPQLRVLLGLDEFNAIVSGMVTWMGSFKLDMVKSWIGIRVRGVAR